MLHTSCATLRLTLWAYIEPFISKPQILYLELSVDISLPYPKELVEHNIFGDSLWLRWYCCKQVWGSYLSIQGRKRGKIKLLAVEKKKRRNNMHSQREKEEKKIKRCKKLASLNLIHCWLYLGRLEWSKGPKRWHLAS